MLIVYRVVAVCLLACSTLARAADTFFRVPLSSLEITNGSLPIQDSNSGWRHTNRLIPYAVLDGPGEAYIAGAGEKTGIGWQWVGFVAENAVLVARVPSDEPVTGTVFVPDAQGKALVALKFSLKPGGSGTSPDFFHGKAAYYERLLDSGCPGAAFFRYQAALAHSAAGDETTPPDEQARSMGRVDFDDSYELFTGGRALSENLQLSRPLPPQRGQKPDPEDPLVASGAIQGITVAAFDWSTRRGTVKPELDSLASVIPSDQHAVFFPSFQALMTAMDTVSEEGLPIYRGVLGGSEDGLVFKRYEHQLCLQRTALARLLGPGVVQSVAITGGDPYFPTGTDVAVIFQTSNSSALQGLLRAQLKLALETHGVTARTGEEAGVRYEAVVSEDRTVCAYLGTCGEAVVVTNSLAQFKRLAAVHSGAIPSIATLKEYQFFRTRYPLGKAEETTFIFISDPTIRRWCGPQSRIAASRRLRALALLADATAAHMDELVAGVTTPGAIEPTVPMRTIGDLSLTPTGVRSSVYGGMSFVTPISELDLTQVTTEEENAYKRWRDSYQRNWSWAFDPIGISFGVTKEHVSADLSVMPLILSSEYRTWATATQGVSIAPGAGDPHDAILHAVFAINTDSIAAQQAAGFAAMMASGVHIDPLGWMGKSVSIYADPDPYWVRMLQGDPGDLFEKEGIHTPIALHAEVSSALKLTAFLAAIRSWIEQASPGMAAWETRTYREQPYVCVGLAESAKRQEGGGGFDKTQIFYVANAKALVISPNEDVIKRAIDRQADHAQAPPARQANPWLGQTLALRIRQEGVALFRALQGTTAQEEAQYAAWANLRILDEWKHRYPAKDPVALHQAFWGTQLVSPGGGVYTWDESLKSMASTVYGHPANPKQGAEAHDVLRSFHAGDFGVDLEEQGLRAKMVIERHNN